ncbi:non-homologous end-joining DNA ligase [bacterium]|nr:non-homologous end-joining DNA ligase [bacterium]
MPLEAYRAKRDFTQTREPAVAGRTVAHARPIFVVQEHHASHLHYDFRLEQDGVLKSWAVPKGPSLDPAVKRLAVEVEDHPLAYAGFEGTIPKGQYGGGEVFIWDRGTYEPGAGSIAGGRLDFTLHGDKLKGGFTLLRMKPRARGKPQWLLMKARDTHAAPAGEKPSAGPAVARVTRPKPTRTTAAPAEVELTHPERVVYPDLRLTKGDVFAYYDRVADRLLPFLKDRPVTLERLPGGLLKGAPHFWQKDTPAHYPDWIPRVRLDTERGRPVNYALVNDRATLLYLVNQGTLTFHVWASRVADLDRPDFVLFDLDPGPAPFTDVVAVARAVKAALDAEGVTAVVKTSGKTGLHILTPWVRAGDHDAARAWALEAATRAAEAMPDTATTDIRKAKRGGRVYIDVLQNARGHHAVPPYVLRAVPGATVSTPLDWREVTARLDPAAFTARAVLARLARKKTDPLAALAVTDPG